MILFALDTLFLSFFFSILNVFKKNRFYIYLADIFSLFCFVDLVYFITKSYLITDSFYINIFIYEKLICAFLLIIFIYFNSKEHWRIIALFVMAFASFFLVHSAVFEISTTTRASSIYINSFPQILLFFHYIFASIAQSLFLSSFIISFFFFYERWRVKNKRFGPFIKLLPSLAELDKRILLFISLGFGFLTISLIPGFLIAKEVFKNFYIFDPNNLLNVTLWLMFLIYIVVRKRTKVMTERLSLLILISTILTFFSIFLSYFTVTFHNFR